MVILVNKQITMSILLIVVYSFCSNAQYNKSNDLEVFNDYSKWGYSITPVLYNKASTTRDYGTTVLKNKSMPTIIFGVKRHFFRNRELSINLGIDLSLMPLTNLSFDLMPKDVYSQFNGLNHSEHEFAYLFLALPIKIEYKRKLFNNIFFSFESGIKLMSLTKGSYEPVVRVINEDETEVREVFALRQRTQDKQLQTSMIFSTGVYFVLKKCIIQTNIVYNKTFQNLWKGEYQFGNLLVSEPTRGNYTVSGDFIGLSTTVYFKKRQKKKKKK